MSKNSRIVSLAKDKSLIVLNHDNKLDSIGGQINNFEKQAIPIIENCLNGCCNGTIFINGQSTNNKQSTIIDKSKGIIPNIFQYLFNRMNELYKKRKFTVSISYVQICNGEFKNDLSASESNRKIKIRERSDVNDLEQFFIDSIKSTDKNQIRKSHTICTISTASIRNNIKIFSKLNLVNVVGGMVNIDLSPSIIDVTSTLIHGGNNANNTENLEQEINKLEVKISSLSLQEGEKIHDDRKQLSKCQNDFKSIKIEINNLKKKICIAKNKLFRKEQQNFDRCLRKLTSQLEQKYQNRLNIEENCAHLQNENAKITQEIDEIEKNLDEIVKKSLYNFYEYQRDIDNLRTRQRFQMRKLQLAAMIMNYYIPEKYLRIITRENLESNSCPDQDYYRLNSGRFIRKKLNEIQVEPSRKIVTESVYQEYSTISDYNYDDDGAVFEEF